MWPQNDPAGEAEGAAAGNEIPFEALSIKRLNSFMQMFYKIKA